MQGYIHQLESFGCADGPGSRFIIFFSGCPMRCKFCHNPDTWNMQKGKLYTSEELIKEALSCRSYWGKKGGITVSGGEPLMQLDFLIELLTLAKEKGMKEVKANIFSFNTQSRRMFEAAGFRKTAEEWYAFRIEED